MMTETMTMMMINRSLCLVSADHVEMSVGPSTGSIRYSTLKEKGLVFPQQPLTVNSSSFGGGDS